MLSHKKEERGRHRIEFTTWSQLATEHTASCHILSEQLLKWITPNALGICPTNSDGKHEPSRKSDLTSDSD